MGKDNAFGTQRAFCFGCEQSPCLQITVYNDTVLPMDKGSEYWNAWICVDLQWLRNLMWRCNGAVLQMGKMFPTEI